MTTLSKINERGTWTNLCHPDDLDLEVTHTVSNSVSFEAESISDLVFKSAVADIVHNDIEKACGMPISKAFKLSVPEQAAISALKKSAKKVRKEKKLADLAQKKRTEQARRAVQRSLKVDLMSDEDFKYHTEGLLEEAMLGAKAMLPGARSTGVHMFKAIKKDFLFGGSTKKLEALIGSQSVFALNEMIGFLAMIRVLSCTNDVAARFSVIHLWLKSVGISLVEGTILAGAVTTLIYRCKGHLAPDNDMPVTQAGEVKTKYYAGYYADNIDKLGDLLEYVFDSSFADSIKTLLIGVASLKILPIEHAFTVFNWCGGKLTVPIYEIIRICVKALARIVKVAEDVISGVPISEAVFAKDPFIFHKNQLSNLMFQKDFLYVGLPSPGKYNRSDWLKHAKETRDYFAKREKTVSQLKTKQFSEIAKLRVTIDAAISEVETAVNAAYRLAPYGIILGEDPGIGKSQLVDLVVALWCYVTKTEFSTDLIFHRNMATDFMDTLDNQIAYHYSEVGSDSISILQKMGDVFGRELCSVMDSQPMVANMAAVEKKGKKYIAPQIVIIDSNCPDLGVQFYKRNWGAFARRLPQSIFKVKDEYVQTGGVGLCPAKIAEAPPSHPLDLYKSINVYGFKVTGPTAAEKYQKHGSKDIYDWCLYIMKDMYAHIKSQQYVEELRKSGKMFDFPDLKEAVDVMLKEDEKSDEKSEETPVPEPVVDVEDEKEAPKKSFFSRFFKSKPEADDTALEVDELQEYKDIREGKNLDNIPVPFDPRAMLAGLRLTPITEESIRVEMAGDLVDVPFTEGKEELDQMPMSRFMKCSNLKNLDTSMLKGVQTRLASRFPALNIDEAVEAHLKKAKPLVVTIKGEKCIYVDDRGLPTVCQLKLRTVLAERFSKKVWLRTDGPLPVDDRKVDVADPDLQKLLTLPVTSNVDIAERPVLQSASYFQSFKLRMSWLGELLYHCCWIIPTLIAHFIGVGYSWMQEKIGVWVLKAVMFAITAMLSAYWAQASIPFFIASSLIDNGVQRIQVKSLQWKIRIRGCLSKMYSFFDSILPEDHIIFMMSGAALFCGILATYYMSEKKDKKETQSSLSKMAAQAADPEKAVLLEQALGVGPPMVFRNMNGLADQWGFQKVMPSVAVCRSSDPSCLASLIDGNQRAVAVLQPNGSAISGYALCMERDWFAINEHYFRSPSDEDVFKIIVTTNKVTSKTSITTKTFPVRKRDLVYLKNTDQVLVRLMGINGVSLVKHLVDGDSFSPSGKAYFKGQVLDAAHGPDEFKAKHAADGSVVSFTSALMYIDGGNKPGDCGRGVAYQVDGRSVAIFGTHSAGNNGYGYASRLRKSDVVEALKKTMFTQALSLAEVPHYVSNSLMNLAGLEEAHRKSMFNYNGFEHVNYFGYTGEKIMINQKSRLEKSIFGKSELFEATMKETFGVESFAKTGRPVMQPGFYKRDGEDVYIDPYANGVKKANKPPVSLDRDIMAKVVEEMTEFRLKKLREVGVTKLTPKSVFEATNGTPGDETSRRINSSTATGFGFPGKKARHIPLIDPNGVDRYPTDEVIDLMTEIIKEFELGHQVGFVCKVSLKDEPRAWEKVISGSTRLFYVAPLPHLLLSKMLLSPYYNLMMAHPKAFNCAIGINMHRECDQVFQYLKDFSDLWMEGDYSGFDLTMPYEIRLITATVRRNVLRELGYNDTALTLVEAMLFENLNVLWNINGDICQKIGSIPSGMDGTAQANCDENEAMFRYAFRLTNPTLCFDEWVRLVTFGDDVLAAIKAEIRHRFNNLIFRQVVRDVFLMDYTSAQKDGKLEEFVLPEKAQFLKRYWAKHPQEGVMVAPLIVDSLYKMMHWLMPSDVVSKQEQLKQTCSSFLREAFFHLDADRYTNLRKIVMDIFSSSFALGMNVEVYFPQYNYLREYYFLSDGKKFPTEWSQNFGIVGFTVETEGKCVVIVHTQNNGEANPRVNMLDCTHEEVKQQRSALNIKELLQEKSELEAKIDPDMYPDCCEQDLIKHSLGMQDYQLRTQLEDHVKVLSRIRDIEITVSRMVKLEARKNLRTQCGCFSWMDVIPDELSDAVPIIADYEGWGIPICDNPYTTWHPDPNCDLGFLLEVEEKLQEENQEDVKITWRRLEEVIDKMPIFTQGDEGEMKTGAIETSQEKIGNVISIGGDTEVEFGEASRNLMVGQTVDDAKRFLERGVDAWTAEITVGSKPFYYFNPWDIFLSNPAVRAKVRNFAFLRGDLKARITISASQFHYMLIQVGYIPFARLNEVTITLLTRNYVGSYLNNRLRDTYLSQVRNSMLMTVGDNKPYDIEMPYVSPKACIRLSNSTTAVSAGTAFQDADLGLMYIDPITFLNCGNAAAIATPITLQVHLSMENVVLGGLTGAIMEIQTEGEYVKGPVERIASSVAKVSNAVSSIFPWAKASAMIAGGIEKLAALHGWSVVNILPSVHLPGHIRPDAYQNEVLCISAETGRKMAVDPLQELTVDPRLVGVTEDELVISYIAGINSLLDVFPWTYVDTPLGTDLSSYAVCPAVLANKEALPGGDAYAVTACAFALRPFQWWRADMEYTVVFDKSNFNKGVFGVRFDPVLVQHGLISGDYPLNKQHMMLIDIQETNAFSFCIRWAHHRQWARAPTVIESYQMSSPDLNIVNDEVSNGWFQFFPYTHLTGQDGYANEIAVCVYVRAKNLHVNYHDPHTLPIAIDLRTEGGISFPNEVTCIELNEEVVGETGMTQELFGEEVLSFRPLLKRFFSSYRAPSSAPVTPVTAIALLSNVPPLAPIVNAAYNPSTITDLLSYLRPAFMGMRGTFRKRLFFPSNRFRPCDVVNVGFTSAQTGLLTVGPTSIGLTPYEFSSIGIANFLPAINPGIEFTVPYYNPNYFLPSCTPTTAAVYAPANSNFDPFSIKTYQVQWMNDLQNTPATTLQEVTACGEDFQLLRFIAAPPFSLSP